MSFNSKYFDRKAGSLEEAILKTVRGEAFEPHMMYDPKTGKGYKADTMDDHLRMKKMGYGHEAPKEESKLDELSAAQKKLPPALQKAIKAKEGKKEEADLEEGKVIFDDHDDEDDDFIALTKKLGLKFKTKGDETTVSGSDANIAKMLKTMKMKKDTDGHAMLEKLVGGQKKLDKDKDGDIDGKDFAMLRKSKSKSKSEAFEYGTPEATQNSLNMTPGQSTQEWDEQVGLMHKKHNTMREALAKVWGFEEGHNPFRKEEKVPKGYHRMPDGSIMKDSDMDKKENKTMTGKSMTKVDVDPDIKEKK